MSDAHLDVEIAESLGPSPLKRALAVLVGLTAVASALLVNADGHLAARSDRDAAISARLTVDADATRAGTLLLQAFRNDAARLRVATDSAVILAVAGRSPAQAANDPVFLAETKAIERFGAEAAVMEEQPTRASGLDNLALRLLAPKGGTVAKLTAAADRQARAAEHASGSRSRVTLALALTGVAAALFGLAGVIGGTEVASLALATGALILLAGLSVGASALV